MRLGFILGVLVGCGLLYCCRLLIQHLEQRLLSRSIKSRVVGHVPQDSDTELGQVLEKLGMSPEVDGDSEKPDAERVEMANRALEAFWPHLAAIMETSGRELLPVALTNSKPPWMGSLNLQRLTLGLKAPTLKTAYLRNHVKGKVAIEGDFVWHGDPELVLAMRPLPKKLGLATVAMQLLSGLVRIQASVSALELTGKYFAAVCMDLRDMPRFGGIQLAFLEQPAFTFDLKLHGGDVMLLPGIEDWLTVLIRTTILKPYVLPERLTLKSLDDMTLHNPLTQPLGLLVVKLLSATNVPKADWLSETDSFVRMQVREGQRFDSTVIDNNNNPTWGKEGQGEDFGFLVHEPRHQSLSIVLFDSDPMGSDDMIGWYTLPVRNLPPGKAQKMKVALKAPQADPSGAKGNEGLNSVRLQAKHLKARLKALAHHGPTELFFEATYLPLGGKEVQDACAALRIHRPQVADRQQKHSYQGHSRHQQSSTAAISHSSPSSPGSPSKNGRKPSNGRKRGRSHARDHARGGGKRHASSSDDDGSTGQSQGGRGRADLSHIWHRAERRHARAGRGLQPRSGDHDSRWRAQKDGGRGHREPASEAASTPSSGLSSHSSDDLESSQSDTGSANPRTPLLPHTVRTKRRGVQVPGLRFDQDTKATPGGLQEQPSGDRAGAQQASGPGHLAHQPSGGAGARTNPGVAGPDEQSSNRKHTPHRGSPEDGAEAAATSSSRSPTGSGGTGASELPSSRAGQGGASDSGLADSAAAQQPTGGSQEQPEQQGRKRKGLLGRLRLRKKGRQADLDQGQQKQEQKAKRQQLQPQRGDDTRLLLRELKGLAGSLKRSFSSKHRRKTRDEALQAAGVQNGDAEHAGQNGLHSHPVQSSSALGAAEEQDGHTEGTRFQRARQKAFGFMGDVESKIDARRSAEDNRVPSEPVILSQQGGPAEDLPSDQDAGPGQEGASVAALDRNLSHWLLGGMLYVNVIRAWDLRSRPPWKLGWASTMQVQVSVDDRHLTTCAAKGDEPEWNETLEFFLVAPQLEQEELCIEIEVRDIHMLDDVKGRLRIPMREVRRCRRIQDSWHLKKVHKTGHRSGYIELELTWHDLLDAMDLGHETDA